MDTVLRPGVPQTHPTLREAGSPPLTWTRARMRGAFFSTVILGRTSFSLEKTWMTWVPEAAWMLAEAARARGAGALGATAMPRRVCVGEKAGAKFPVAGGLGLWRGLDRGKRPLPHMSEPHLHRALEGGHGGGV